MHDVRHRILALSFLIVISFGLHTRIGEAQSAAAGRRTERTDGRLEAVEQKQRSEGETESDSEGSSGFGLTVRYESVQVSFKFFGDVGFRYENPAPEEQSHAAFAFGSLDAFITAKIGDRFHVLSETILEGADDEIGVDQERLWGAWTFSDSLYVKLGVEHTVITHWNRRFHHGKWLETTIERPFLARFEDDGGFLPMHYAGIEAGGKLATSWGELNYTAIVSNGRGIAPEDRQLLSDKNDAKAVEVALSFAPTRLAGFQSGVAFRFDEIPPDQLNAARADSIQELIWSAYVEWYLGSIELLGEFVLMQHEDHTSDQTFRHMFFYVQASYQLGAWTPYGRFDFRNMKVGDPFFAPTDGDLDRWEQTFGLRYDFTNQAALKLEVGLGQSERRRDPASVRTDWFVTTALQLAWFF